MEILAKLTPAETYLIKEDSNSTYKEMLKLTLADLLLKKVLQTENREHQSHPRNPVRVIKYVTRGRNFDLYKPKQHESVYTGVFTEDKEITVMFSHLIKMAYQNGINRNKFVFDAIIPHTDNNEFFKLNFINEFFGRIILNEKGNNLQSGIKATLLQLGDILPALITTDKKKALEILKVINGNVFLVPGLDFEILRDIDTELEEKIDQQFEDTYYGCSGCFTSYGDNSGSFDGAFDSADSSSSGGFGGGCSGCSGCGGCGGCGGCS